MYYVYFLRCRDGSLYAGITTDLVRREREHLSGGAKSANYTRSHHAVGMAAAWSAPDRQTASRLEYRLKQLTREQKDALIAGTALEAVLGAALDCTCYARVEIARA